MPARRFRTFDHACVAPASRAASSTAAIARGASVRPGRIGASATPAAMPASASVLMARRRWRGGATPGSRRELTDSSSVAMLTLTMTSARRAASDEHVDVAHDERAAGDDAERRARRTQRPMQPRVSRYRPSAGWYGSVAAPMATSSRRQPRRASSDRSTSTTLTLTRTFEPYRSSDGRSARRSKPRT